MIVSTPPEITVTVFLDGDAIHIPESIQHELVETYKRCIEEQKTQEKTRELKRGILFSKIRRLVPEAPIPPALLRAGMRDDLFQTMTMFTDMCRHVHDCSKDWKIDEGIFSHHRFQEIEEISEMLSQEVKKAIKADDRTLQLIDNLIQAIKKIAYYPCKRKLGTIQAKQILPSMTEEEKDQVFISLQNNIQIENYYNLTNVCRQIIELREKGDKDSDEVKDLYRRATSLLGVVFSLSRDSKALTDSAQDMINVARRAEPPKSWLW